MPLLKALSFAGKFPQLNNKVEELERLMDHPPLKQTDRLFEGQGHDIRFENVHFSYKDAEVIHGIDLTIKEGQMAALVGESGSGKSTLAKLLVHFYDLNSGCITLGGQDISDMRIEAQGTHDELLKKLGAHLRRMPMGFFTEGNIGRISSVLSTDMVFIEENLMTVLADLMSYLFSAALFVIFMFAFDWRMGLAALVITAVFFCIGEAMKKNTLMHSAERQAASQQVTDAVIDFTEGIGIIKTYNLLGEKSKELAESFSVNCEKNLHNKKE